MCFHVDLKAPDAPPHIIIKNDEQTRDLFAVIDRAAYFIFRDLITLDNVPVYKHDVIAFLKSRTAVSKYKFGAYGFIEKTKDTIKFKENYDGTLAETVEIPKKYWKGIVKFIRANS